jgi:integrase
VDGRKVPKKKTTKRKPSFLNAEQVAPVLAEVPARWRSLFATAIYSALRKGELLGLTKADVDLNHRLIHVRHSHGHDSTKGGHDDVIPIAAELVPHLKGAIDASATDLVFPHPRGGRWAENINLTKILRTAVRRARIVTGYVHRCRRKGCGFSDPSQDGSPRRCPKCDMKLWVMGQVPAIRFHDLRHTTAALLLRSGASPAAVQQILRHSDIRTTLNVYGHMGEAREFLQREVDRLSFGTPAPAPLPRPLSAATGENFGGFAAPVLPSPLSGSTGGSEALLQLPEITPTLRGRGDRIRTCPGSLGKN